MAVLAAAFAPSECLGFRDLGMVLYPMIYFLLLNYDVSCTPLDQAERSPIMCWLCLSCRYVNCAAEAEVAIQSNYMERDCLACGWLFSLDINITVTKVEIMGNPVVSKV